LQVKQGSGWKDLEIGDRVPDSATVQFDGSGVAELEGSGVRVTLKLRGTYQLAEIVAKSKEVSATGLGSMVKGRVAGVMRGTQKNESTVAGVRAAEAGSDKEKVSWLGSATDLMAQAKRSLESGDYEKALSPLTEAYDYADESEEPEILYYTALANAMLDRSAKALEVISDVKMAPTDQLYGDFLVLRGQLLVDALSFKDAYGSFDTYRSALPAGPSIQLANLMAGFCAMQLGERAEARKSLDQAQRADPSSELGKKAQELLTKL
jgi:Tfp pilus assembly protein PilF